MQEQEKTMQSLTESYEDSIKTIKDEHLIYRDIVSKLKKDEKLISDTIDEQDIDICD